jgi:ABC-type hemin transport system substrate-binding protein
VRVGELAKSLGALCAAVLAAACSGGAPPHRVISVSSATTRVAQALGLGTELESLDPADPNALQTALASPANLVISDASPESAQIRAAFAARSVAVRVFSPASTADVLTAYTEIATVLGRPKAAAALIDKINREVAAHPVARAGGGPVHVALIVSKAPLRVVGGDAFLTRLLHGAGVETAFAAEPGVAVAIRREQLDAQKPDQVLELAPGTLERTWVEPVETVNGVLGALK